MTSAELSALSVADLQALLRTGEISASEALSSLRERIALIDPTIDAYLSFDYDAAAEEAKKADVTLPLGGVPDRGQRYH